MYDYGWRMYMPDIGRWNAMDPLSENYMSHSPYVYVMNNPVMMTDPDGRYHLLSQAFESSPDFKNNSQKYIMGGSGGRSASWNALNIWMATVGNSTPTHTPHGNTTENTVSNEGSSGTDSYDCDLRTIDIPEIILKGQVSNWGQQIFTQFNSYMNSWNAQDVFNNFLGGLGNLTNAGEVVWSTSELAAKFNAGSVASAMGIETRQVATQMPKFLGVASKVGARIGAVGYLASSLSLANKYRNNQPISTSEYVSFGINTAIVGATVVLSGTAAAPFIATGALIYGAAELGTYFFTQGSIEDQIFGNYLQ